MFIMGQGTDNYTLVVPANLFYVILTCYPMTTNV